MKPVARHTTRRHALRAIGTMQGLRHFPRNTCPSTRHTQMLAEALVEDGRCAMLEEDPAHVGASVATAIAHLYAARTMLESLGYAWSIESGVPVWKPQDVS